jgi:CRISPR type IV-associated protein Csf3
MLEAQMLGGPKVRSINIKGGPSKSYRIPMQMAHLRRDEMLWYCVGDEASVRDLVELVSYLGKKRSVGLGRVRRWTVSPIEAWEGFPVLDRERRPLRPLPLDWPGLGEHRVEMMTLAPPYWQRWREEECAVA